MIAEDEPGAAFAQAGDDLVAEAELVDGIAGAEQLIDGAHAGKSGVQRLDIAVDVGEDA